MRSQIPLQRLVALLGLAAAACLLLLAAPARGDPIVGKWNALVTDAMAQKKIGANAVRAFVWMCICMWVHGCVCGDRV